MNNNDHFELKVLVKATGDTVSLDQVMRTYNESLKELESGISPLSSNNTKLQRQNDFLALSKTIAAASAALIGLKLAADKAAQMQDDAIDNFGNKAGDMQDVADFYNSDARTVATVQGVLKSYAIDIEDFNKVIGQFAQASKQGQIGNISTANFQEKDLVKGFLNFFTSVASNKGISTAEKLETFSQMGINSRNLSRFLGLAVEDPTKVANRYTDFYNRGGSDFNKNNLELANQVDRRDYAKALGLFDGNVSGAKTLASNKQDVEERNKNAYLQNKQAAEDAALAFSSLGKQLASFSNEVDIATSNLKKLVGNNYSAQDMANFKKRDVFDNPFNGKV